MTAETATINLNALAAAAIFCSTEETRYYLNGVMIEIERDAITYVATDGHRLFAHRDETGPKADPHTLLGQFIVPTASCKALKPNKRVPLATLTRGEGKWLTLTHIDGQHGFKPIDGTFPNWRAILKLEPVGAPSTMKFNWPYLVDFDKAAKLLDLGQSVLVPRGVHAATIWFSKPTDSFGVLMPVVKYADQSARPIPAWAAPPPPTETEADALAEAAE